MGFLERLFGSGLGSTRRAAAGRVQTAFEEERSRIAKAGSVDGSHYTQHVERVKDLKRAKRHEEVIELLLKLVDATEAEARVAGRGWGVAPWYYEQLAIVYRKERRYADEVAILQRYQAQARAPGVGPKKLADRLAKAQRLLREERTRDG